MEVVKNEEGEKSSPVLEAQALLEQEKKERAEACAKEIQEVLTKHKCKLEAFSQLRAEAL